MTRFPKYKSLYRGNLLVKQALGFTLVEVMVAVVVSFIVVGSAYLFLANQERSFKAESDVSQAQRDVRSALKAIVTLLRPAGYNPTNIPTYVGLANISATSLQIKADLNEDGDGSCCTTGNEDVTITFYKTDPITSLPKNEIQIVRNTNTAATTATFTDIEDLTFTYYDESSTELTAPVNPIDVRTIEIAIKGTSKTRTQEHISRVMPLNLAL